MERVPRIRLFGPVTVSDGGDLALPLGGLRQRALLTALALRPGRPVPIPDLVAALWDEHPPSSVHNALQVHISGLRKLLNPLGLRIVRNGATYSLDCTIGDVDVALFEALVASAQSLLRGGDAPMAVKMLERARNLGQAPLLAGLDVSSSLAQARRAVEDHRLAARRDLIVALYQSGQAERAVDEALTLVADDPLDEASWSRLMTAQYHAGRPHAALEAYQAARQRLLDDLGVEPSPQLVALHHAILNHQLVSPTPSAPVIDDVPTPALLGRESLLTEVGEALQRHRLVTLHGPGGVGKSALASTIAGQLLAAGHQVTMVQLMPFVDALPASEAIMRALEHPMSQVGQHLVVADNVEQIDGFAELAAGLLADAPDLRLLVTSRNRLGSEREHAVAVPPLGTSNSEGSTAEELFVHRAHQARPDVDPVSATAELRKLCQLSGGLPLAIELLAARTRVASPARLLDQFHRDGTSDVLTWATNACSPRARLLLHAMAEIRGPVSGRLADILSPHPDALLELANSLLVVGPTANDQFHVPRPVAEALGPSNATVRQVLLDAITNLVRPGHGSPPRLSDLIENQAAVIRAAQLSIRAGQATLLLPWLPRFWVASHRLPEGIRLLSQTIVDVDEDEAVPLRVALEQLNTSAGQADPVRFEAALEAAVRSSWRSSPLVVTGWCSLGRVYTDPSDVLRCAEQARAAAGSDPGLLEIALSFSAHAAAALGDTERAVDLGLENVSLLRRSDEPRELTLALCRLVQPLLQLDRIKQATACMDEAMELAARHPLDTAAGVAVSASAALLKLAEGKPAAAIGMATVVLSHLDDGEDSLRHQVTALRCLALGNQQLGGTVLAAQFLGAADHAQRRLGADIDVDWAPAFAATRTALLATGTFPAHYAVGTSDPEGVVQRWMARVREA